MNFNKVIIAGYLTRDPELKYVPSGDAVCNFSIAINRSWTSDAGEKKEAVTFVECTAWRRTGEAIAQYLTKGRPIHVEGRLDVQAWEKEGEKRSKMFVTVESFQFVDRKPEGGTPERQPAASRSRSPGDAARAAGAASASYDAPPHEGDDVPF